MKITEIKAFAFQDSVRVEFVPIKNAPPSTHRVYIVEIGFVITKDWFTPIPGQKKPNKKSAQFYYDKHITQRKQREASAMVGVSQGSL